MYGLDMDELTGSIPRLSGTFAFLRSASAVALLVAASSTSADWPMWRHDANRSGATAEKLTDTLRLLWRRDYPRLEPAFPELPGNRLGSRMLRDGIYEPVVLGKSLFVGSSRNDSLTAIDTDTGGEKWRFYADGPIRLAPLAYRSSSGDDRVCFTSDDGCLYCLSASDGSLIWRFRGALSDRKVLGHDRLVSTWPARGGPVLADGRIYFAAGIFSFMGTAIYAIDAESGEMVWHYDSTTLHKGGSWLSVGIDPQGHLVACRDELIVPLGRTYPAVFKRKTGRYLRKLRYVNARAEATSSCMAKGSLVCSGAVVCDTEAGAGVVSAWAQVLTDDALYGNPIDPPGLPWWRRWVLRDAKTLIAWDTKNARTVEKHCEELRKKRAVLEMPERWRMSLPQGMEVAIKAGNRLYANNGSTILAIDLPGEAGEPNVPWRAEVNGTPASLVVADQKLFAVTHEGSIYCFGPGRGEPKVHRLAQRILHSGGDHWASRAQGILRTTGIKEGYCVAIGIGTGQLIDELVRQSKLHIIVLDSDRRKVSQCRRRLDAAGLYGSRVAAHVGDAQTFPLPQYMASLVVSENATDLVSSRASVEKVFRTLRPHGGVACFALRSGHFADLVGDAKLPNAQLSSEGDLVLLRRVGALPGSADWTQQGADAAHTSCVDDRLIRSPLGLLWFGGKTDLIANRTEKQPLISDGLMFVHGKSVHPGPSHVHAVDTYTGRLLWRREMDLEVALSDGVYDGKRRYDRMTGEQTLEYPHEFTKCWEGYLIGSSGEGTPAQINVMDRRAAKLLWSHEARQGVVAFAAGNGKVFYYDSLPIPTLEARRRRGESADTGQSALVALDIRDGRLLWRQPVDPVAHIFEQQLAAPPQHSPSSPLAAHVGQPLSYSEEHDVLLGSDNAYRVFAYRGGDGSLLWDRVMLKDLRAAWLSYDKGNKYKHLCPFILNGNTLYTQHREVYDLLTGEPKTRTNPLTGERVPWRLGLGGKGCDKRVGSRHLIVSREWTAAFEDLSSHCGASFLCSVRSACYESTLIAAGGLLQCPNTSGFCGCPLFAIATSFALTHMPKNEFWSVTSFDRGPEPIKRLGLNLGAPGDRRARDGTLWLKCPLDRPRLPGMSYEAPKISIPVVVKPRHPRWVYQHSLRIGHGPRRWVAASGAEGLSGVTVGLIDGPERECSYTVRLYFAELRAAPPGQRLFDVALQGQTVLKSFDICEAAGGVNRSIVREFTGVAVKDSLTIQLTPSSGATIRLPLLCGVEAVMEE